MKFIKVAIPNEAEFVNTDSPIKIGDTKFVSLNAKFILWMKDCLPHLDFKTKIITIEGTIFYSLHPRTIIEAVLKKE